MLKTGIILIVISVIVLPIAILAGMFGLFQIEFIAAQLYYLSPILLIA